MSYFNDDQRDYMRGLATLKPEEKCACGWHLRGQCYGNLEKGGAAKPEKADVASRAEAEADA